MICTAVPKDALDIVWADASGLLNKAIQTSKGKYHIDDIYHDLTKGLYSLWLVIDDNCLLYTSPSPRDVNRSRMPSSA